MFRCFHAGSYLHFLRWTATPALLIAVLLAFGCESGLLVEGPVGRRVGTSSASGPPAGPQSKLGDHDPEAKVYESLRPKDEVLAELKSGECLAHFARAGSDKFTPLPFALDWPRGEPAVEDGKTPAVASVGRLRGEESVLRVLCLFPNTDWHRGVLAKLFEEQLAKPPFKQDADGWLRVRDEWKGSGSASASAVPDLAKEPLSGPSGSGAVRLGRSAGPCHWTIVWDADAGEWVAMHQCPEIVVCGAGLDWDEASGTCVATGGGSGPTVPPPPPPPPSPPGGSNGGGTSPSPPSPSEPECTDDQISIAAEYNDPGNWPCDKFTHLVLGGGDHGHTTGYLSEGFYSGSAAVLAAVPGSWINSDWRCPQGNAALPNSSSNSQHVQGTAGDFDAPNFDEDTYNDFAEAAESAGGRTSGYRDPETGQCRDGGTWCYSTYIHIDW